MVVKRSRRSGDDTRPSILEIPMKSSIEHTAEGLRIQVAVPQEKQAELIQELGKCAGGTCSCPTPQYEKLSAIDLKTTPEGVRVDLKVKPGEQVDVADIEKCLEHTAKQVGA
jgi:hypothetical protein